MNWDQIEGNWKQFNGKVKEKWGDLTDDEPTKAPASGMSSSGAPEAIRVGTRPAQREVDELAVTGDGAISPAEAPLPRAGAASPSAAAGRGWPPIHEMEVAV